MAILIDDLTFAAGEIFEVKCRAEQMAAWQFAFEFDSETLDFQDFIKKEATNRHLAFGQTAAAEGTPANGEARQRRLAAVFHGRSAIEFSLRFQAKKPGQLSQHLHLSHTHTPAAAYDDEGRELEVELRFGEAETPVSPIAHHASPNPFASQTTLYFNLPEAGEAHFQFFDATGKLWHRTAAYFAAGENRLMVRSEDLKTEGLVFYRIESGGEVASGKLLVE